MAAVTEAAEVFDVGGEPADNSLLETLRGHAAEVNDLESNIDQAEETLQALRARRHHLLSEAMPDIMVQIGMQEIKVEDCKFTLGTYVRASWPKETEARDAAVVWLEKNEGAGIIKTTLTARFPRSEHELAATARQRIEGLTEDVTVAPGVHPATLTKFVRERLENGEPVDMDALNASTGPIVKVTRPKARR